ncbi:hypothetical protein J6590_017647 [Homalodisca vitripennis]|nr:hypothetical protein J6590_017647 [Homalodisca vitripennis]
MIDVELGLTQYKVWVLREAIHFKVDTTRHRTRGALFIAPSSGNSPDPSASHSSPPRCIISSNGIDFCTDNRSSKDQSWISLYYS